MLSTKAQKQAQCRPTSSADQALSETRWGRKYSKKKDGKEKMKKRDGRDGRIVDATPTHTPDAVKV